MDESRIRFDDGAAYESFMGTWSLLAGEEFLQWLAPPRDARWVDVGCGNGAFTELVVARCAPLHVDGVDPSDAQLDYARARLATAPVRFATGDAMALPYPDADYDVAVMALVIFFVPEPAAGVAEMVRVVRSGGLVSAYAWDTLGGGFPYAVVQQAMAAIGIPPVWPPSVDASRIERLQALWIEAGLTDVETHTLRVERAFPDFETFWALAQTGPPLAPRLGGLGRADRERLRDGVRERATIDDVGRVVLHATANAVRGRVA